MDNQINFSIITVSGPDAETFLQGQLTCDVTKVTQHESYGAYCDQRGRVICNFMIKKDNDDFQLILPSSVCENSERTLAKYAAFSKVSISTSQTSPQAKQAFIEKGIAFIYEETSLLFTPQMINWEKHGGVSFEKGCYLGQEIVARTQHLGKLKRHLHGFSIEADQSLVPGNKLVNHKNEQVGVLCDAIVIGNQSHCLAVIQDQALHEDIILNNAHVGNIA